MNTENIVIYNYKNKQFVDPVNYLPKINIDCIDNNNDLCLLIDLEHMYDTFLQNYVNITKLNYDELLNIIDIRDKLSYQISHLSIQTKKITHYQMQKSTINSLI